MLRRSSHLLAAFSLFSVLFLAPGFNRASDGTSDSGVVVQTEEKWPTTRTTAPESTEELKALQARVEKVVKKCTPETVAILIGFGAGSGVIVSEDGLVLTAAHVITGEDLMGKGGPYESGKPCTIVLADGKHVKGKTLGVNSDNDVGMVQITDKGPNNGKWPFLPVAKSATLKKGEWVVSLGHPGGPKIGRPPVARLGRIEARTSDIVRSNCTLVGGDSGGPLFDLDGNVVGIHSRIGLTLAQNIHVPIELFQAQWKQLVNGEIFGRVAKRPGAKPLLGVVFPEDDDDDAWITEEVEADTPAGKAGLKAGDTITKFNTEPVKSVKRLRELMKEKKPGDTVKFTIRRGTTVLTVPLTFGSKKN
jgi:serine protease Do